VLRKVAELANAGATIVGPRPKESPSLSDDESEYRRLVSELWEKGRIISDRTAREVLQAAGVPPDCEFAAGDSQTDLDYIHRRAEDADIYFVANRNPRAEQVTAVFRVSGKAPELWNPVTGERYFVRVYTEQDGRTSMLLDFPPCGSWFVVFREAASRHPPQEIPLSSRWMVLREISGPWQVTFDPKWGGPGTVTFEKLESWTARPEPGIKYYSGTAIYENEFEVTEAEIAKDLGQLWLDLGSVRELAEVFVNDRSCGIVWAPPFRVDVGEAIRAGKNRVRIEVVNFWPNRIIGDASLLEEKRLTRTNIRKLTADTELMPSGLLGPVQIGRVK